MGGSILAESLPGKCVLSDFKIRIPAAWTGPRIEKNAMITMMTFLFWLPMIVLAFLNAALRELVFRKYLSDIQANRWSVISLIILCGVYLGLIFRFLHIASTGQALATGACWMGLTVLFEFGLGLLQRRPVQELLGQYDLAEGQIWPVFLLFLLLLPYVLYVFR